MSTTTNHNIPYLDEGQRSKEAAINNAYDVIDAAIGAPIMGTYANPAALPAASANANQLAIVTDDGSGNELFVFSDGTNWRRLASSSGAFPIVA